MRYAGGFAGLLSVLVLGLVMSDARAGAPGDADVKQALQPERAAWRQFEPCVSQDLCNRFFDSFGLALVFADGSTKPFAHVQRLIASGHDCIQKAKSYLAQGEPVLAVQWVLASQSDVRTRDWLRDHPDAVLEALRRCCM